MKTIVLHAQKGSSIKQQSTKGFKNFGHHVLFFARITGGIDGICLGWQGRFLGWPWLPQQLNIAFVPLLIIIILSFSRSSHYSGS